jgi:hypothetical protein
MRPVETVPGMGGGGIKKNDEEVNSTWYIVRTFVNVTMYPQHNNNRKRKKEKKKLIWV